jgi:predicted ATPase/DNA-binding winged helix-turn-helix (wHTH) protein
MSLQSYWRHDHAVKGMIEPMLGTERTRACKQGPNPRGLSFGPYTVIPAERCLETSGTAIPLNGRVFEVLMALLSDAGVPVGKAKLLAAGWPDVKVDEGSLRAAIATLRRALGEDRHLIRHIPGVGYAFDALVTPDFAPLAATAAIANASALPPEPVRIIGRESFIATLTASIRQQRVVSIVGPGGVGKTTVALIVAHALISDFKDGVFFVDLAAVADPLLVGSAIAAVLGLPVNATDLADAIVNFLRSRRVLLVLDSCEHVIETAAAFAENIHDGALAVTLLITSRESLRIVSEMTLRLQPLKLPDDDVPAAAALDFPAVRLFVERANAQAGAWDPTLDEAALVSICRRLDGIPLAIELVASRVGAYGTAGLLELLETQFGLSITGFRTALPRHQTLKATLDWSLNLLDGTERAVLKRLASFAGWFCAEAARFVAGADGINPIATLDALASMVAKSLVSTQASACGMRYRLLSTTRAYVLTTCTDTEREDAALAHARYYIERLRHMKRDAATLTALEASALYRDLLSNLRAALTWAFSSARGGPLRVPLAAVSATPFLELSLLAECQRWTEAAITSLEDAECDGEFALELWTALGLALLFSASNREQVARALGAGRTLAEHRGALRHRIIFLDRLVLFHLRAADYGILRDFADQHDALLASVSEPILVPRSDWIRALWAHFQGAQITSLSLAERALWLHQADFRDYSLLMGQDYRIPALVVRARALFLLGRTEAARIALRETMDVAEATENAVTLCIALTWSTALLLWLGDTTTASGFADRLAHIAAQHSLPQHQALGLAWQGATAAARGEFAAGAVLLERGLVALNDIQYELLTTPFLAAYGDAVWRSGRRAQGLALLNRALDRLDRTGEIVYRPEFLRQRAIMCAAENPAEAVSLLDAAASDATRQGARAWQALIAETRATLRLA